MLRMKNGIPDLADKVGDFFLEKKELREISRARKFILSFKKGGGHFSACSKRNELGVNQLIVVES